MADVVVPSEGAKVRVRKCLMDWGGESAVVLKNALSDYLVVALAAALESFAGERVNGKLDKAIQEIEHPEPRDYTPTVLVSRAVVGIYLRSLKEVHHG